MTAFDQTPPGVPGPALSVNGRSRRSVATSLVRSQLLPAALTSVVDLERPRARGIVAPPGELETAAAALP